MEQRWLAYRDVAGASFSASLSSALPIGKGWRGGYVHAAEEILAFDELVRNAADEVGAALGMWRGTGYSYGVAARREHAEIPFLLGFDPTSAPESATDAVARCAYGSSYTGWRQKTAQALSAWSVNAPSTPDPLEVDAVLQITDPDVDVVETLCRLFGMAVPVERELDEADRAAIARASLALAAERKRKRRSFETAW
jgi:hypothetical protein